jgi:hypothetical protein
MRTFCNALFFKTIGIRYYKLGGQLAVPLRRICVRDISYLWLLFATLYLHDAMNVVNMNLKFN